MNLPKNLEKILPVTRLLVGGTFSIHYTCDHQEASVQGDYYHLDKEEYVFFENWEIVSRTIISKTETDNSPFLNKKYDEVNCDFIIYDQTANSNWSQSITCRATGQEFEDSWSSEDWESKNDFLDLQCKLLDLAIEKITARTHGYCQTDFCAQTKVARILGQEEGEGLAAFTIAYTKFFQNEL